MMSINNTAERLLTASDAPRIMSHQTWYRSDGRIRSRWERRRGSSSLVRHIQWPSNTSYAPVDLFPHAILQPLGWYRALLPSSRLFAHLATMFLIGISAVIIEGHDGCDKVQYVGDSEGPYLSLGDLISLDYPAACLP
jgi:hypothetical protein